MIYADYILQYKPEYKIESDDNGITIESIAIEKKGSKPIFGFWDEDIFAQLLANYWSVYGIEREDILQLPLFLFLLFLMFISSIFFCSGREDLSNIIN